VVLLPEALLAVDLPDLQGLAVLQDLPGQDQAPQLPPALPPRAPETDQVSPMEETPPAPMEAKLSLAAPSSWDCLRVIARPSSRPNRKNIRSNMPPR